MSRIFMLALLLAAAAGCSAPTVSSQPEQAPRQDPAAETTAAPTPTATPAPTSTPAPTATPAPTPFSIVWMSDTQNISNSHPEEFFLLRDWILQEKDARSIRSVLHTGDIVGTANREDAWQTADAALSPLRDAGMDVFLLGGNHDSLNGKCKDFSNYLAFRGSYASEQELSYAGGLITALPFTAAGRDFLLVGVSCNQLRSDPDALQWLNDTLDAYPDATAILCFHSYMYSRDYISDGVIAFPELVAKHSNVRLVLCGHARGFLNRPVSFDDDGDGVDDRTVDQIMINYQSDENTRLLYLALLTFFPEDGRMDVTTYSPKLDRWGLFKDGRDTFSVENVFEGTVE